MYDDLYNNINNAKLEEIFEIISKHNEDVIEFNNNIVKSVELFLILYFLLIGYLIIKDFINGSFKDV